MKLLHLSNSAFGPEIIQTIVPCLIKTFAFINSAFGPEIIQILVSCSRHNL